MENQKNNYAILSGTIVEADTEPHDVQGEQTIRVVCTSKRLSGEADEIPVEIPVALLDGQDPTTLLNKEIKFEGEFRSHNKLENGKSRLILNFYAQKICEKTGDDQNDLYFVGTICKQPIYRVTPKGREICDVLMAINRGDGNSDYIPCIAWGREAKVLRDCLAGDKIETYGAKKFLANLQNGESVEELKPVPARMQSRIYTKNGEERVAYEVSIARVDICELAHKIDDDSRMIII